MLSRSLRINGDRLSGLYNKSLHPTFPAAGASSNAAEFNPLGGLAMRIFISSILLSLAQPLMALSEGRPRGRGWEGTPASSGVLILIGLSFVAAGIWGGSSGNRIPESMRWQGKLLSIVAVLGGAYAIYTGIIFILRGGPV